jgi:hypothetical protein
LKAIEISWSGGDARERGIGEVRKGKLCFF